MENKSGKEHEYERTLMQAVIKESESVYKTYAFEQGGVEMSNATAQRQYNTLILGDGADGFFDMNPNNLQLNNNMLEIGGTGTGKTKSIVETNLLHSHYKSMVVLLTKKRLMNLYEPLLKKRGYDV